MRWLDLCNISIPVYFITGYVNIYVYVDHGLIYYLPSQILSLYCFLCRFNVVCLIKQNIFYNKTE